MRKTSCRLVASLVIVGALLNAVPCAAQSLYYTISDAALTTSCNISDDEVAQEVPGQWSPQRANLICVDPPNLTEVSDHDCTEVVWPAWQNVAAHHQIRYTFTRVWQSDGIGNMLGCGTYPGPINWYTDREYILMNHFRTTTQVSCP